MSANHASTADRELVFTRVYDAPRDLVYEAWTNPKHVVNWWGPKGFTITISEMDVRPGGVWRLVMHGPDGRDYDNHIVFSEVVKPERLVYAHVPTDTEDVTHESTVTFTPMGDKTSVTMRLVFTSAAAMAHVVKNFHADEGGHQHLQCLAEYLGSLK